MDEVTDFDSPLFKRLAKNDTGSAAGHQSGVLVPKALEDYFPTLTGTAGPNNPTLSTPITAILVLDGSYKSTVITRYQYQTWGGTRTPERRITGGLGPILQNANGGDFVLFERSVSGSLVYRLSVIRSGTPAHHQMATLAGHRNYGPINAADAPVRESEIEVERAAQLAQEQMPLELFDSSAALVESKSLRIARSRAFAERIRELYDTCVVCGSAHRASNGASEIEAAHIVPRSVKGADDARNGLALCRSHHWAFDKGLFSVTDLRTVLLSPSLSAYPGNEHLAAIDGAALKHPSDPLRAPSLAALQWHRQHIFVA